MENRRRPTKIVCTLGPASSDISAIRRLVASGMNVARLNFSHGTHKEHGGRIEAIREVAKETGKSIGIMQDLGGPKIRLGKLPSGGRAVAQGDTVRLRPTGSENHDDDPSSIPVGYDHLLDDIKVDGRVLIDDGRVELVVDRVDADCLACSVYRGGQLESLKGVTFPDQELRLNSPTDADLNSLDFGLAKGVDFVAISFVQSALDIRRTRQYIRDRNMDTPIVAKIERQVALDNVEEIVDVSDGVMVARGDLGVESDITMVPVHQKRIVETAIRHGKAVIVATQMLESMMESEMPSRAEASDIAQAVYSGADGIMLSGETSVGRFPDAAVRTMAKIADNVYTSLGTDATSFRSERVDEVDPQQMAIVQSVCAAAEQLRAASIIAHTLTGETARLIAQQRPEQPIVAITPQESTRNRLALYWGIQSLLVPNLESSFVDAIKNGDRWLMENGIVKKGDLTVVTAGIPEGKSGGTNVMKIHVVGS